ncbi:MAG: flippase-like domain-containing protein [Acidobacteria bacterium]|nr:flippase-like domain-containing protein [Acidobacteriota bacterium]MCL5287636.1 flippase-like domain-containing protein [Acidobacteriota bacterium]
MRPTARKALLLLLVVAVVGFLIYRSRDAIRLEGFNWDKLGASIRHADVPLLLLALLCVQICFALRALRWTRFSRYLVRASFANIYASTVIGFSAIFLLGRAAEPVRPLLIARKEDLSVSGEFGIYVLERMFDMASTVVLAAVALLLVPRLAAAGEGNPLLAAARTTGVVLLVGLVLGIAFLVYFRLHGAAKLERRMDAWRTHAAAGWRQRVAGLVGGFSQGLQAIRSWNDFLIAAGISVAHWVLVAIVYYVVAQSFGGRLAELRPADALLVLAFTMAGSTVQLPGVGGGSQVASFLAFTVIFGVEKEPAAAAAIVLWLITFAGSMVFGIPLLIKEGWSMGDLRRMARAEKEAEAHGGHIAVKPGAAPANNSGKAGGESQR